jgi:uncharacterized membrane protein YeaQ/YmgE (transglycosylase-associated protein family)
MGIVALIIIGAAAGYLATRLLQVEANMVVTVSIGVLGALLGGFILRTLATMMGWAAGFVGAVMGAMLLVWLWQRYGPRM